MVLRAPHLATAADLLRLPEESRHHEVIAGALIEKAAPSGPHALAEGQVVAQLTGPFGRRSGGGDLGGWWILPEVEIALEVHEIYRPDVAGWRRARMEELPRESPILVSPDWVCEVLSPSNARHDLVHKLRIYQRARVGHYWIIDPERQTLVVHRWTPEGFLLVVTADPAERVRAEPFGAIELDVGALFGLD